jgi:RNA polymerase sigma-70 factor (ECF subfamily)
LLGSHNQRSSTELPDSSRALKGRPVAVMGFTITHGKIVEINILADPARLSQLDVAVLSD